MSRSTPWGTSQQSISITTGVSFVITAGHAGFMLTEVAANKYLSGEARDRGEKYRGYYCYEDDCAAHIVFFDSPAILQKAIKCGRMFTKEPSEEEIKSTSHANLSLWNADYLVAIGVEPEPEAYEEWKTRKECDRLRESKDPDYIVSAARIKDGAGQRMVRVITADNESHIVTSDSYTAAKSEPITRLSSCQVVETAALLA